MSLTSEPEFQRSYATPVPRVQCTYVDPHGNMCTSLSLRGADVCLKHGASLPVVQKHAASVLSAARMRLINSTDDAVDTLIDLMQPGTPEGVRLKAAAEVLDRSGIRAGYEIDVQVETKRSPADILAERLKRFKNPNTDQSSDSYIDYDAILDAEIVEPDDE